MKPSVPTSRLPWWIRLLLWAFSAEPEDLLPPSRPVLPAPSPELVARAARELEQARLALQLQQADGILGVALGGAWVDHRTGRYVARVDERWLS